MVVEMLAIILGRRFLSRFPASAPAQVDRIEVGIGHSYVIDCTWNIDQRTDSTQRNNWIWVSRPHIESSPGLDAMPLLASNRAGEIQRMAEFEEDNFDAANDEKEGRAKAEARWARHCAAWDGFQSWTAPCSRFGR